MLSNVLYVFAYTPMNLKGSIGSACFLPNAGSRIMPQETVLSVFIWRKTPLKTQ